MHSCGNAVRGTPYRAGWEEPRSDGVISGVRRLKGTPIGPTAASKRELQVSLNYPSLATRRDHPTQDSKLLDERHGLPSHRFSGDWEIDSKMGPKPTPAWGHLLLGIEARTPSFEPNSTKQSETQKKIAGMDDSSISTSTAIRGLRIVSEGTNRCRQ